MPNAIAYLMLLLWPVLATVLFRRLPREQALVWSILGAYMLLPPLASFNLPAIPDMDKFTISNLCALGLTVWVLGERPGFLPGNLVGKALMVLFVASPFATALTNPDVIPIMAGDVPALRIYDSLASVSYQIIALIPFFLARRLLATADGMKVMVQALVIAGLIYSVPMALESRLSPQINVWVYGFFQHDFSQSMRGGGFRPMVFMPHGLWVAFFALMAAMSALLLLRLAPPDERPKRLVVWVYLMILLVLCRSTGPMVYALGLIPLILFAPKRLQVILAGLLAVVVITYPLLRGAHLIPLDVILDLALSYSEARHQSLEYRIVNEEQLLARAQEKPWFGWGGYGRALILDPITGRILSVPDGQWIIVLGTYGWAGYVAEFGLLTLPLFLLAREAVLGRAADLSPFVTLIALIYAANLADLLPNATLIPFSWLMAGAILGHAEMLARARAERREQQWRDALAIRSGPRTVL
ncbi:hypothetical protein [Szabonella alba]|uniref:O-antigen ligase like membrane protein n=1 Tax=Szabonella alba TaxID=2804194 RepID=A0A8K0XYM6_9RHOB|nr:hypothetical protein [Szabonella alba]MBL4915901.1 hypothetical protein [Szabonella alba]